MERLRDRIEDYIDSRAPVWALMLVGVALFAAALVLLLLLPRPPFLQLAGIFAIAVAGSWSLRTGLRVGRERKQAALADSETGRDRTGVDHDDIACKKS